MLLQLLNSMPIWQPCASMVITGTSNLPLQRFFSGFFKIRHFQSPSLFLDGIQIPEVSSVKVLGFVFDSSLTWQKHIDQVLSCGKQRLSQLYHCRSLFGCEGVAIHYKSWIRPILEYGSILYSGAALSHLNCLECLQARVENLCGLVFPSLTTCCNASILGLTCRLLAGEG